MPATPVRPRPSRRTRARFTLAGILALVLTATAPVSAQGPPGDPAEHPALAPIDAQSWVDMAEQTWDDYVPVRPDEWLTDAVTGSMEQFNGAVVLADFVDQPFLITQAPETHPFGNPQPGHEPVAPEDVNQWMHEYYTVPNEYNGGQTIHGYWMENSHGRIGVTVDTFGPYTLDGKLHEYGLAGFGLPVGDQDDSFCPAGDDCTKSLRSDSRAAWEAAEGSDIISQYDFIFYVSAGHDESSTWQEMGEMLFETKEDVPAAFGPPGAEDGPVYNSAGNEIPNWAGTRYVEWTSWQAAANHWPNASNFPPPRSSTQAESSGQSVFAHEFSHLLGLPDNYNNPFRDNVRNYTGYWEMMSRGTFNGPGGTHNRWQVPNQGGSGLGPHHMVHFKNQLGVLTDDEQVVLDRNDLDDNGIAVVTVKARSSIPGDDQVALTVNFGDGGYQPGHCEDQGDPGFWCPSGTNWQSYTLEVVDQVGNDSFTPGHGVLLAQTRTIGFPDVWLIDANPQDIGMIDFYRPDGTPVPVVRGDPRQLNDATFHAGTNSGSRYEYVDEPNRLHFYVLDTWRGDDGSLYYDLAVRHLDGAGSHDRGVAVDAPTKTPQRQGFLATCTFPLTNTGAAGEGVYGADVYRVSASSSSDAWEVTVPNALAAAEPGETVEVPVHVLRTGGSGQTTVTLTVTSESDATATAASTCDVHVRDTRPTAG